jgi:rhamnose transport system ATP-binding protein
VEAAPALGQYPVHGLRLTHQAQYNPKEQLVSEYILELSKISKRFSGVEVLHEVSFTLKPGEVHALLGENGAGKSTLVKVITGVHQPDGGQIFLNGQLTHFSDPRESRQAGIAAIYQELSLFPDLDVAENVFVGRQPTTRDGRIDWRKLYDEAGKLLSSLGLHLNLKQKARSLSIAQQQMVEIARAFSINARILIMDEPTSSLTLNEVADLFRLVRRLREDGTAIIFISHRLEELFELADRVTVLRDGSYVDTRPLKEVSRDDLIRLMVGRTISNLFPKQEFQAGEVALKVENLSRSGIFEDISFELRRGEILGMAGLVGAGRTDVARAIFGVEPPTSGKIEVEGQEVRVTSPQQAINLGLAYVPEDRQLHGLIPPMNLISNISLPMIGQYARRGWLRDKVERGATFAAARRMEVRANNVWQKARELSGGNQQKIVLAKWLETKPRILILDEPTRGIDVGTKAAVHALMSKLAAEGIAILMISSELPEVLGMSDRVIVMHEGRMTGQFTRAEATQEKIISAATMTVTNGGEQ